MNTDDVSIILSWFDVRDMLLGQNKTLKNVELALKRARGCAHPVAQRLVAVMSNADASSVKQVLQQQTSDADLLCLAALIEGRDLELLAAAATLKSALALAMLARESWGTSSYELCQKVVAALRADGNEKEALHWLGWSYETANGCDDDAKQAAACYLRAAKLGHVEAMKHFGYLTQSSKKRWTWWCKAALKGGFDAFLDGFVDEIQEFARGQENQRCAFLIGQTLHSNIDRDKKRFFGREPVSLYRWKDQLGAADIAISFYEARVLARKCVDTWTLVGIRWKVVKDIRKLIAKLIWDFRDDYWCGIPEKKVKPNPHTLGFA